MDELLPYLTRPEVAERVRTHHRKIASLLDQGVIIPAPGSVEIAPEIDPTRIAAGVILHAGTRLRGARTLLAPGVVVGREAPATLEGVVAGHGAALDGGFYQDCTFLDGAGTRSGAHVRGGCLFEEHASAAHSVGVKQTLLFPFVTLGSLINFCDVLMAGGTGNKDHSEVGSGYIHFNFTPRGDKATPSLYGDVPRGVLLRERRIFLGGLAATVGPMTVGYGSFLGPGEVYRRSVGEDRFLLGERTIQMDLEFDPKVLTGLAGKLRRNFTYIGQLVALERWYAQARPLLTGGDLHRRQVFEAGRQTVQAALTERIGQLSKLIAMVPESIERLEAIHAEGRAIEDQRRLLERWPGCEAALRAAVQLPGDTQARDQALGEITSKVGEGDYVTAIRSLGEGGAQAVRAWLSSLVKATEASAQAALNG